MGQTIAAEGCKGTGAAQGPPTRKAGGGSAGLVAAACLGDDSGRGGDPLSSSDSDPYPPRRSMAFALHG